MNCPKCGTNLPDDAISCAECADSPSIPGSELSPPKKSKRVPIIVAICAVLALGVVLILGLLIGVGTVGWTAAIKSGNETSAAQSIDKVRILEAQYAARHTGNFTTFDELVARLGLDTRFKGERPVVNGYVFGLTVIPSSGTTPSFYSITADPQVSEGLSSTGTKHFYTDSTLGSIKATDENRPARVDDPSL